MSLKIKFVKLSCILLSAPSSGCILALRKTDDKNMMKDWDHSGLVFSVQFGTAVWRTDIKRRLLLNLQIMLLYLKVCNTAVSHVHIEQ